MIDTSTRYRIFFAVVTTIAFAFSVFIVVDTIRTVTAFWSPLPWFDEWATTNLIGAWQHGDMTAWQALSSQHNEHRILVPRLVFLADDLLFGGRGRMTMWVIFLVQFSHAGLFAIILGQSRPAHAGRWAIGAVVLAMMFSLHQAENFSSGFQLQFVAVFASATLCLMLFSLAALRERQGRRDVGLTSATSLALVVTTFTMANGLISAYVILLLAILIRLSIRTIVIYLTLTLLLTFIYLHGYQTVAYHGRPTEILCHPLEFLSYVATYLGNVVSISGLNAAAPLGFAGIVATACATLRVVRSEPLRPGPLAMLGVMLFIGSTAVVTASGRLNFGTSQALSSRYVTGSVVFWSAQIVYWWIDPPRLAFSPVYDHFLEKFPVRFAIFPLSLLLLVSIEQAQSPAKTQMAIQSFAQGHASDALMLGLYDPEAMANTSWMEGEGSPSVDILKRNRLSIFSTADAASVGRPFTERGVVSEPCEGSVASAVADPTLGREGVKVAGSASAGQGHRRVRRILLVDGMSRVVGLATGGVPQLGRDHWLGYAVAPIGAAITAYGLDGGRRLCLIGRAEVASQ